MKTEEEYKEWYAKENAYEDWDDMWNDYSIHLRTATLENDLMNSYAQHVTEQKDKEIERLKGNTFKDWVDVLDAFIDKIQDQATTSLDFARYLEEDIAEILSHLTKCNQDQSKEIEILKEKLKLEGSICGGYVDEIAEKDKEIQSWKEKYEKLVVGKELYHENERLEKEIEAYKLQCGELDPLLVKDIENHNRLHGVIKERDKEIEYLKKKVVIAEQFRREDSADAQGDYLFIWDQWQHAKKEIERLKSNYRTSEERSNTKI